MDSRELNKIAAAVVCAVAAFGCADLAGAVLVPVAHPARPAFPIAGVSADGVAAAPERAPIGTRLASASAAHGEQLAGSLCASCHSLVKGAPAAVGPNLYGVAGGPVAAVADYEYSPALKQVGGRWTPERLDGWLIRPQAFAPGTRMGFAGIPNDTDRADVVAYLLTLSDNQPAPTSPPPPAAGSTSTSTSFASAVAHADVKAGEATATASCSTCHSFDKNGEAQVGPALYGVFGRGIGQGADYSYSTALSGKHGNWTVDTLDDWLKSPRHFAPGTKMAFPGIADDASRAAVVAFLRSLSG